MSRRNLQPYWLKKLLGRCNKFYVNYYIAPQFDSIGKGLQVMNPRYLEISGPKIEVGDFVHFMALRDKPLRLAVFDGLGSITIGDYCLINPGVRISSASEIKIGHSCMFAMNAYLSDADWHDLQHRIYAPGNTKAIELGNNVWLGDSALVCKGVQIGDNSIVGAWSVVTKDVPANTIVAGNPAKKVGEIDPSHITTRQDLFNMEEPYEVFETRWFTELHVGNTLLNWLRSKVRPSKLD